MERVESLMQEASALVQQARTASPAQVAIVQVDCREVWKRLFNALCTGDNPSATSAYITEGLGGSFVQLCLEAQEIPWPDGRCRLRIAEDAMGILDNCADAAFLRAQGCPERVCAGLAAHEDLLAADPHTVAVSGALESYALLLARLMRKTQDVPPCFQTACQVLLRLLRRPTLEDDAFETCCDALRVYSLKGAALQLEADAGTLQALKAYAERKLPAANAYLRTHEAYAMLVGESEVLSGMAAMRTSRDVWHKTPARPQTAALPAEALPAEALPA